MTVERWASSAYLVLLLRQIDSKLINIEQTMPIHLLIMYICGVTDIKHLIMKELDQKDMAENERQELQDRYIRFDWAIKVRHEVLLLIV